MEFRKHRGRRSAVTRRQWRIITGLFLGLLFVLGAQASHAQPASLKFCYHDYEPVSYTDAGGRAAGLSIDVLHEATSRAGIQIGYENRPWVRCLQEIASGKFHGAPYALPREGLLSSKTHTVYFVLSVVMNRFDATTGFGGLETLKGKTGVFLKGASLPPALLTGHGYIREDVNSIGSAMRMLDKGRADFAFMDLIAFRFLQKKMNTQLKILAPPLMVMKTGPLYSPNMGDYAVAIDVALSEMTEDGSLDDLYQQWLGISYQKVISIAGQTDNM